MAAVGGHIAQIFIFACRSPLFNRFLATDEPNFGPQNDDAASAAAAAIESYVNARTRQMQNPMFVNNAGGAAKLHKRSGFAYSAGSSGNIQPTEVPHLMVEGADAAATGRAT